MYANKAYAWEQRKLGKVLDFSLKTNSLSRSMLNYEDGELKNIHYGDILMNYGPILDFKTETIPYITEEKVENFTSQLLMDGDVVFADAAEDESVGKAIEINGLEEQYLVAGLHTIVGRPVVKFAERFLGYYINSNSYHNQLLPLMQGTKVSSISKSTLQKTLIVYPKENNEQLKIGEFLNCLDNSITLHQRKYDALKTMKKTLLSKMFPKDGEDVPEIRFKGFTDAWEQRKLGEIAISFSGGTPKVGESSFYGGDIPFIRSGEIGSYRTELTLSLEGLNNSSASLVNKGDILYALYGATSGEVEISKINGAINQAILAIRPYDDFDSYTIVQWLKKEKENIISTYLQGGQGNLSGAIIKNLDLVLPSKKEEQKLIGKYFKMIDNLITLHQRKLDELKNMKKTLLQQMFV